MADFVKCTIYNRKTTDAIRILTSILWNVYFCYIVFFIIQLCIENIVQKKRWYTWYIYL